MKKYNNKENPKALNLLAIQGINKKVTLGFKCAPELKIKLAEKAAIQGLTLSAYVESFLENADNLIFTINQRNHHLTKEVTTLSQKVRFYENDILNTLYESYKGKSVSYKNTVGENVNLLIKSQEDVYIVMVNSFK